VNLFKWLSRLLLVVGLGLFSYAQTMPVYTDPDAPRRLSAELMLYEPHEERFTQWHARLKQYETPQKRLSDTGRCLVGMAAGLWLSRMILGKIRSQSGLLAAWMGLWLLRIPLSWWWYTLREDRSDFPNWGRSPSFSMWVEFLLWPVAGVVTLLILLPFLGNRHIPGRFVLRKPAGAWNWIRTGILWLWVAALLWLVGEGVYYGDEGTVTACLGAVAVLLRILSMRPGNVDPLDLAETGLTACAGSPSN
jgi:hypothetical protein